ncbi:MAG: hypothetical protein EHM70_00890 [Chloroflexota bacterium]|nr:MAG: hypothetical protein EHM70_00890 [Chloroflexota bacterium]
MDLRKLFQRIEIAFWKRCIPFMGESRVAGFVVRSAYTIVICPGWKQTLAQMLAVVAAGLSMGFALGLLRSFIR